MAKKHHKLTVNVVLDTNCLFTDAAHTLLNLETTELIKESNTTSDIDTIWHLPVVVRGERKYQMILRAERFLPQIEKLESLLGHKLAITREVLVERVEVAISNQIKSMNLRDLPFDPSKVDWQQLVGRAINRDAPFETGDKEKGFRDAIILECFCQLVETVPKTLSICRNFLITNDALLRKAAEERVGAQPNVRVVATLEEFRTIINALKSEISEALLSTLLPVARKLFWNHEDDACLWHRSIKGALYEANPNAQILANTPGQGGTVSKTSVELPTNTFIKKIGQKVFFETKVQVNVMVTTSTVVNVPATAPDLLSSTNYLGKTAVIPPPGPSSGMVGSSIPPNALLASILGQMTPTIVEKKRKGAHDFAAKWHATLTTAGKLKNAQLDSLEHVETTWAD